MSWVKAHAYNSEQFVLGPLLERLKADIQEANRLPEDARNGSQFNLNETGEKSTRVNVISNLGAVFLASFSVLWDSPSSMVAVQDLGREDRRHFSLHARWDEDLQAEVWFVNGDEKTRYAVEDITRMILKPVMFATSR